MSTKSALRADLDAPLGVVVGMQARAAARCAEKRCQRIGMATWRRVCPTPIEFAAYFSDPRFIPRGDHRHRGCGRRVTARRKQG
jgi:hypothetical protein